MWPVADSFGMPRSFSTSTRSRRESSLRASVAVVLFLLTSAPVQAQRTVLVYDMPEPTRVTRPAPTPPFDVAHVSDLIHELVNAERSRHGLSPLRRSSALERVSYHHSRDMGTRGYFDHIDLRGQNATRRAKSLGYVCMAADGNSTPAALGENLFAGYRYSEYSLTYFPGEVVTDFEWITEEEFARQAVDAWMDSPGHRENLLHPAYHSQGIGVHLTDSYEIFVTQNLC